MPLAKRDLVARDARWKTHRVSRSTVDADLTSREDDRPIRVRQLVPVFASAKARLPTVHLDTRPVHLGREPAGEVAFLVDDDEASRQHAMVVLDAERDAWLVVDQASRNGTFVDGARVERAELRHGSVIRVGRSLLVFVDVELAAGAALAPETPGLLGHSISMQRLRAEIALVAPRDLAVLVLGETGAGKENVAAQIHLASGRTGAFVPVNCASIPATLADSTLFGHAAGAFTGAVGPTEGLFARADRGTLFLDEIGELPADVQPKLLRALATGEIRPLGRTETRRVDVRVIAATHRDMRRQVDEGAFRSDLFGRLSSWELPVPALRDRKDDILRLTHALLKRHGHDVSLTRGAAEALLVAGWPRNVRELEHVVVAAAIRAAADGRIRLEHLPDAISSQVKGPNEARSRSRTSSELPLALVVAPHVVPSREALERALLHFQGSVAEVAAYFGKDRKQIYRWMERHGVQRRPLG